MCNFATECIMLYDHSREIVNALKAKNQAQ